ncbi:MULTISPECIES: hypothetical protein [Stenotrophomonas]|uniref:hypothetical protein n=1 Tax=Stenotrophomonas TaxID=40323 RepID=UPI000871F849|nr:MULTISPECIES: hypothetical protein [Stenotrophomonas]OEZ02306.1 hypothetical protein BIY45_01900 [Stenotrophomonas sp. BIIR7]
MRQLIYITEQEAADAGMTHEGRLFGVPAWLRVDSDEQVTGTPKVPALHLWCWVADLAMELKACFFYVDEVVESPISIGRRIEGA